MKKYIVELRVHHYVKNLLVFAALVFSGCLFDISKLISGIWGFMTFCMASSAIYVINDIRDIDKDKAHPTKCNRPIAAGIISLKKAWIMVAILVLLSLAFNLIEFSISSSLFLALYLMLNIGYSYGLKNVPIVDVTIIVSGYLIRVIYGAIMTRLEISSWLYLTVISIAFYLALGKRRNELIQINVGTKRKVLQFYSVGFLDKNMYMCLGLANVFYAMWAMNKGMDGGDYSKYIIWTVPMVLLIFMKYSMNIEGNSDGDPVEVLVHDKVLMVMCSVYAIIMGIILYL